MGNHATHSCVGVLVGHNFGLAKDCLHCQRPGLMKALEIVKQEVDKSGESESYYAAALVIEARIHNALHRPEESEALVQSAPIEAKPVEAKPVDVERLTVMIWERWTGAELLCDAVRAALVEMGHVVK
jgi:hypothetical protein